jgi:hypothetical protein
MHSALDGDLLARCPGTNDEDAAKVFNPKDCHLCPRRRPAGV